MAYKNNEYDEYLSDIDFYNNKKTTNKYNKNNTPGLDIFGNIMLNTVVEVPKLSKNIRYYSNKDYTYNESNNSSIQLKPIEVYFI